MSIGICLMSVDAGAQVAIFTQVDGLSTDPWVLGSHTDDAAALSIRGHTMSFTSTESSLLLGFTSPSCLW